MAIYLDCNATTPMEPQVRELMLHYFEVEYGNEGSRTHDYGARAKQAVQKARDQVAAVVAAKREEVLFTSGATESNNLAILGLKDAGEKLGKKHVITTAIEHKAVLEPYDALGREGFDVTIVPVGAGGAVDPDAIRAALRPDTLLVSVMQVNNETGIRQPLESIAEILRDHAAYFHTDAAQGFGKEIDPLRNQRIDLISISGHKIFGPKGTGALIMRRRGFQRPPLQPLLYGGGQERGLRPGTLPVPLIVALGAAAEASVRDNEKRRLQCRKMREEALRALAPLNPRLTGDQSLVVDHVLNVSFGEIDSEALIVALKDLIAVSNGSACTSSSYTPSHVLKAMGMTDAEASRCLRVSWSHLTPAVNWEMAATAITSLG